VTPPNDPTPADETRPEPDDTEALVPEALGDLFGGGDMPDLGSLVDGLAAVQTIQSATYEGSAGGGLVRITANGRMDVERVVVSPDALGDGTDVDLLADLVHAALRDLTAQIAAAQQQAMGPLGGILGS
jgi:DNA-binding protein YbaB